MTDHQKWHQASGSRPAGLQDADLFEFRRDGKVSVHRADGFNWDIWCKFRPAEIQSRNNLKREPT